MCFTVPARSVHTLVCRAVCAFLCRQPLHLLLQGVYPLSQQQGSSSRRPISIYIALLLYLLCAPVPWCTALQTAAPLWGARELRLCSATTQLSLTAHHGCASTPFIVAIKLSLLQCQSGFRARREPGQLSEIVFKPQDKFAKFSF